MSKGTSKIEASLQFFSQKVQTINMSLCVNSIIQNVLNFADIRDVLFHVPLCVGVFIILFWIKLKNIQTFNSLNSRFS